MSVLSRSALALFFSALALFLYQILWFRLLGFSENSDTATILIALSTGLALGALFAQWWLQKGNPALKLFIFSQILAAISAVLLLPILIAPEQIVALSPSQQIASWDGFLTLFIIAFIPASASGMAFPLLATWFARTHPQKQNTSIHYFYFIFLFATLIATLLGGLYILPSFGLTGGIYFAAGFNLIAALLAYALLYATPPKTSTNISPPPTETQFSLVSWHQLKWIVTLAVISFIWMGSEIILSKFISLYAGSTLFSFTAVLATSLAGVTLGAWLLHNQQTKQPLAVKHLFILLFALFIALNITRLLLSYAPQLYNDAHYLGELLNHSDSLWFALMILLPNIVFGATLSLALSLYCREKNTSQQNIGFAYGIYITASMSGAVITALWLIPNLGSHYTLLVFTLTPILLAILFIPKITFIKKPLIGYTILICFSIGAFFLPPLSFQEVFKQHYYRYVNTETPVIDLRIFEESSGVIGLTLYERESLHLQVNGLTQSKVHIRHPHKGNINESLTALLPVLFQENPTEALVLGFRAGIITRVLANSDLEGVVITIEPEPRVVESMLVLNMLVNFPFLDDGRVDIEYNDFRSALRNHDEHYSIITAQAPYVWQTDATRQYSKDFFNLIKSRLKPDGIFGYHLNLLRMDATTLKSVLQTFYSVFPKGVVFGDPNMGGIVLLGSNQPLVMDFERTQTYFNEQQEAMETIRYGDLRNTNELPHYFLFTRDTAQQMAGDAKLITDRNLLVETRIKNLSKNIPQGENDPYQLLNQYIQKRPDRL